VEEKEKKRGRANTSKDGEEEEVGSSSMEEWRATSAPILIA
jgi:hypothetical protein